VGDLQSFLDIVSEFAFSSFSYIWFNVKTLSLVIAILNIWLTQNNLQYSIGIGYNFEQGPIKDRPIQVWIISVNRC
jgi:hypothetical protein